MTAAVLTRLMVHRDAAKDARDRLKNSASSDVQNGNPDELVAVFRHVDLALASIRAMRSHP